MTIASLKNRSSTSAAWIPAACVVLAALIWSTDTVVRPLATGLSPANLVFFEHLLGLLFIAPIALGKYGRALFRLTLREGALLITVGLGGGVLGGVLFNHSSQMIGAGLPTLIVMAQPAAVVVLAYLFLRERMDSAFFPLSFWVILNALLIAYPLLEQGVDPNLSENFFFGLVLAVLAALMWAVATVSGKAALRTVPPLVAVFWRWAAASFGLALALALNTQESFQPLSAAVSAGWPLLYLALVAGVLPMGIYYVGLRRIPASLATFLELIYPLGGIFLTVAFSDQPVSLLQLAGGCTLVIVLAFLAWISLIQQQPKARTRR